MISLKLNQGLSIGVESFIVTGCISYRNGSDTWDEYTLINSSGNTAWLSVDNNDGELVLSRVASSRGCPPNYKVVDQGTAIVTNRFGDTDVDLGERVRFTEYEDELGYYTYSVEVWDDETEYSEGHYIKESEVQLLDTPPFERRSFIGSSSSSYGSGSSSYSGGSSSLFGKVIGYVIAGVVFIIAPLVSCLSGGSCEDSCKACSASDPNYEQCVQEYNNCVQTRNIRRSSRRTRSSSGGGMHHGK